MAYQEYSPILEEGVGNVHDTGMELRDGNLGTLLHLAYGIQQTVRRHTSVRVNDQDVIAHADIAISPGTSLIIPQDLGQAVTVSSELVFVVPLRVSLNGCQLILNPVADIESVVHVASLLEFATAEELLLAICGVGIMRWARHPSNVVFVIKVTSGLGILLAENLHSIIVDKDARGASLHFVCADGRLDGHYRWLNDRVEALLVHGHLYRNMRERVDFAIESPRSLAAVIFAVGVDCRNGAKGLEDDANDSLEKELIHNFSAVSAKKRSQN